MESGQGHFFTFLKAIQRRNGVKLQQHYIRETAVQGLLTSSCSAWGFTVASVSMRRVSALAEQLLPAAPNRKTNAVVVLLLETEGLLAFVNLDLGLWKMFPGGFLYSFYVVQGWSQKLTENRVKREVCLGAEIGNPCIREDLQKVHASCN